MTDAVLAVHQPPGAGSIRAIALVLHGGQSKSQARVRATQLAVLRMRPFVRTLRRDGAEAGLAVAELRYRVRGWNGSMQSPVADTRWALDQLAERFPDVPVALVGHSMGARAALYAAGHPSVQVVVGLAPWIELGDPYLQLAGRRVLIVHGTRDRMTDPTASAEYAHLAEQVAAAVTYIGIGNEGHAMLRRPGLWHQLASGFVLGTMCGRPPHGTEQDDATNLLTKALAGEVTLVV